MYRVSSDLSSLAQPPLLGLTRVAFYARGRATVYVEGEIDIATAPQLLGVLHQAVQDGVDLTVDLSDVTFFGVSGLNAMAWAARRLGETGRKLTVLGARGTTRRLFAVTGLESLLAGVDVTCRSAAREQVAAEGS